MKKLTLLLILMVASVSFAQIRKVEASQSTSTTNTEEEIGKLELAGKLYVKLTKKDNVYTFTYQDFEYKTTPMYRKFSFEETGSDLESLYAMIQEGFETQPKDAVMLDLKDYYLFLHFEKVMGSPVVGFSSKPKGDDSPTLSYNMTKKELDKLFGKSKKKK